MVCFNTNTATGSLQGENWLLCGQFTNGFDTRLPLPRPVVIAKQDSGVFTSVESVDIALSLGSSGSKPGLALGSKHSQTSLVLVGSKKSYHIHSHEKRWGK